LFSQIQTSEITYIQENCTAACNVYLDDNPDVKKNGMSAWSHYENFGKREGRKWPRCLTSHSIDLNTLEEFYKKNKDSVYKIQQINNYQPIKIDSLFIQGSKNFNGLYYNYYDNKQIKSIQEIIDGKVRGITTEFWNDKSYIFSNYQDTVLLNNTKKILGQAKYDLALCIQDTAKYNSDERNYLKNEIGGYEKLQKLINQNDQNKLNSEKKTKFEHYVKLAQLVNSSIQRLYVIKKSISELEKKINIESSKKVFIPIKSIEYYQFDTLKQGKAIIYNSSGVKISEGEYKNNLENNKWTFYSNNSIIEETDYELGQIHGVKKTYDKNGKIQSEAFYKKGELHGIKKEFYENGEIYSTTEYVNGKKSGMYTVFKYNQQGKQFECYYLNDKKNGKEINYNLTGNFIYWEYSYLNDEKEGPFKEYHDNGSIKNEGTFSKNRKNGLYKEYFLNGKLKLDANFTNDKRNGKHKTFYESGQIETEILYANDKEHGLKISYYSNGKVNRKTTVDTNSLAVIYAYPFNDNNVVGDYYKYNEDGTLSNHYFAYKDGRLDIKFPKPEPVAISSNGKSLRDPRSKGEANVFWNGEFPLYSHLVDIEITPDADGIYKMWCATNEDKTPRELWLRKGERKNVYKFKTYEECIIWCRGY
jgi:antitoxin component YwqK of YwqJK toxin-antitoxin module